MTRRLRRIASSTASRAWRPIAASAARLNEVRKKIMLGARVIPMPGSR
jgi:hypothetical protein